VFYALSLTAEVSLLSTLSNIDVYAHAHWRLLGARFAEEVYFSLTPPDAQMERLASAWQTFKAHTANAETWEQLRGLLRTHVWEGRKISSWAPMPEITCAWRRAIVNSDFSS
jgi:hypothetical protein